jgi:hypothetical protein
MTMSRDPREREFQDKFVAFDKIELKRSHQARVRINPGRVQELADVLQAGGKFTENPAPPEVYYNGYVYWVGDGFHRLRAYELAGRVKVWARVREGSDRDALIHALGANAEHGLPRKPEDVRRAIRMALADDELKKLSNRSLAKLVHCHDKTVAAVKRELGLDGDTRTYTDRYGNTSEMDVSGLKNRPRVTLMGDAPVNAFHDLPAPARTVLKDVLRVIRDLPKQSYSFVLSWLQGQLPPTPKEAGRLLTQLEAEEEAAPDDDDHGDEDLKF